MRRTIRRSKFFLLFLLFCATSFGQVPIIFDTDMGNDIDDALALAMLHSLADRGECRLIGITLTNANPLAVPYVRLLDKFYGRAGLPVGAALRHIKDGDHDNYLGAAMQSVPAAYRDIKPEPPRVPAVVLLRRLLAGSSQKVTIVQVGFSTNLAALLDSPGDSISPMSGKELVKQKVLLLSAMAGNFSQPKPEYNVKLDIGAAQTVFEKWPTPIVFSGFEIGQKLLYPQESIETDFTYSGWHPVTASYRAYAKMPYSRPTWDLTAVLQAVRGHHQYFDVSENGNVSVDDSGVTRFTPGDRDRRYLILNPARTAGILEALTLLVSQPPRQNRAK